MTALPAFNTLPGERRGYAPGGGGQVHYREMGQGPGVLLLHQAPWGSIQFRRIAPLLAAQGFRAVAPDLPGHGLSDPVDPPTVEAFADAVLSVADALGLAHFAVAGHHGGGLVALRLAAVAGDRVEALALDNAPFYTADERATRRSAVAEAPLTADGSHFTDRWALARRVGDPGWSVETIHLSVVSYFANGPTREDLHRAAPAYDLGPDLGRVDAPALVMAGRGDPLFAHAERLLAAHPDWQRHDYDGGASLVFDRPEEWVETVAGFLHHATDR